jgi:DNA-directed RNA polymerase subunit RPC12/RpoP
MKPTQIITCTNCGNLLIATDGQKTRTCPYCGKKITVNKAKHVASARNAFEASKLLQKLKQEKGFNRQ